MGKIVLCWFLGLTLIGSIAGCAGRRYGQPSGRACDCTSFNAATRNRPADSAPPPPARSGFAWFEEEPPVTPRVEVSPPRPDRGSEKSDVVKPSTANRAAAPMPQESLPDKEKAAAFTSVTGQVHEYRKTWRLRYADIGQEDPYGGAVVLEGHADLSKLRDGCRVRVTGTLVPPTTRKGSASYLVQTIEILD